VANVYLALGSNDEPVRMLGQAYHALNQYFSPLTMSPVYKNKAIGFEGADFYNCVSHFVTEKSLLAVSEIVRDIQYALDTDYDAHQFNVRKLDLDLLIYDDVVENTLGKAIPHADITQYAFMLKPLVDIAADYQHPTLDKTFQQLWDAFPHKAHTLQLIPFTWRL
jgi:2-amino-4-hydroxy-6-hydroxymethyldihydropteridine diphosphokinase